MKFSVLICFLPFMFFMLTYYLAHRLLIPSLQQMPALVGLSLQEAARHLAPLHLNIRLLAEQEDAQLPAGTILHQTPAAQQKVRPYQTIFVTLAKEPLKHTVPDLHNKPLTHIQELCIKHGWQLKTYYLESNQPHDHCIGHIPGPGETVDKQLLVYVSKDTTNKPRIMPSLVNLRVPKALDFLQQNDMQATIIHEYPPGIYHRCSCKIQDQRPIAGSFITGKEPIQLFVV